MNGIESLPKTKLVALAEKGDRALTRARGLKEVAKAQMGHAVQTVEVGIAAFGFGFARGNWTNKEGKYEVMGVQPDLLSALALHGLAYAGSFDTYDRDAHNLGDGALACYLVSKGVQMGVERKDKTTATAPAVTAPVAAAGALPIGAMTDADVANVMAQSAAA